MNSVRVPGDRLTIRGVTRGLILLAVVLSMTTIAATPRASASLPGLSTPQRIALARNEARHLLTLAIFPKGSQHIATWIVADGDQLAQPMITTGNVNQIDITQFYLAPSGSSALAWLRGHVPKGAQLTSMGTTSGLNSGGESEVTYTFAGTSILPRPELEYSMMITPHHQLEMRVDAIVIYRPQAS